MNATTMIESLDAAKAAEVTLAEQLGDALLRGDDPEKIESLQFDLRVATDRVAELQLKVNAVTAAKAAGERAKTEAEQREAREARAALIGEAVADRADLVKKAAKIDAALGKLDDALDAMQADARAFAAKYEPTLKFRGPNRFYISYERWVEETLAHLKNRSHLRGALYGSGLSVDSAAGNGAAQSVPSFESIFGFGPHDHEITTPKKEAA